MEAKQEVPSWLENLAYEHQHKSTSRGRPKRYKSANSLKTFVLEYEFSRLDTFLTGFLLQVLWRLWSQRLPADGWGW